MYEYITPVVILALWWYDPTLLLKLQRYIKHKATHMALTMVDLYADVKNSGKPNEMVKDGYHVNFVYLEEITDFPPNERFFTEYITVGRGSFQSG